MKARRSYARTFLLVASSTLLLAGCGGGMGGCNGQQNDQGVIGTAIVDSSAPGPEEGPQYQQPTVDNLKVPQKFPARYPVKRYPNSRVVMAYVRKDLAPGQRNCVLLTSSDTNFAVNNYYQKTLTQEGWTAVSTEGNSAYSRTLFRKGDQMAEVVVTPDPHGVNHLQLFSGPYQPPRKFASDIKPELNIREN